MAAGCWLLQWGTLQSGQNQDSTDGRLNNHLFIFSFYIIYNLQWLKLFFFKLMQMWWIVIARFKVQGLSVCLYFRQEIYSLLFLVSFLYHPCSFRPDWMLRTKLIFWNSSVKFFRLQEKEQIIFLLYLIFTCCFTVFLVSPCLS